MDAISHGLWGGIAFGRKNKSLYFLAFLFGIFPDIFAFTYTFLTYLIRGRAITGPIPSVPDYVFTLYGISHSLIIAAATAILVLIIWRRRAWPVLAWPLHILFDIPTHDLAFFPTPFLWPFNTPYFSGIPWSRPWVFFMNWGALAVLYALWRVLKPTNYESKRIDE